jgi:hypothetical protein
MEQIDEPIAGKTPESNPEALESIPAARVRLDKIFLVLAILSAGLAFLPQLAQTALLHWKIISREHDSIELLGRLSFAAFIICMLASWSLEKEEEEHQSIIFGLLAAIILVIDWAIGAVVPFESWWQALYLAPALIYGALAAAFLADISGKQLAPPPDEEPEV